jgi:hypothetical protein
MPVTPARIRSPANDCGDPAWYDSFFSHAPICQVSGGAVNVRPSVLTNIAASAPGANVKPKSRCLIAVSFDPHE